VALAVREIESALAAEHSRKSSIVARMRSNTTLHLTSGCCPKLLSGMLTGSPERIFAGSSGNSCTMGRNENRDKFGAGDGNRTRKEAYRVVSTSAKLLIY
jgi:hypothetical protein